MPRPIDSLQASLKLAQARLKECRNQRLLFEQQMDCNSCADHRVLARLEDDEQRFERDVQLAEQKILEAQRSRFRLADIQIGKIWSWLPGSWSH
jgi:hypothetical protein